MSERPYETYATGYKNDGYEITSPNGEVFDGIDDYTLELNALLRLLKWSKDLLEDMQWQHHNTGCGDKPCDWCLEAGKNLTEIHAILKKDKQ